MKLYVFQFTVHIFTIYKDSPGVTFTYNFCKDQISALDFIIMWVVTAV
jgi:hypothetical protein